MSIVLAVRSRLSAKISLMLAVLLLVLTAGAAGIIMVGQTRQMEELTLPVLGPVVSARQYPFRSLRRHGATLAMGSDWSARQWGDVFDAAVDAGQLTVADVFDRNYQEIKGWNWGPNPKFHTRFDTFTDKAVLVFQDRYLDTEDFIFAVGVDLAGYLPTHNSRFQKPLTGDPEKDLAGNRSKRLFTDPVGLAAAKNTEATLKQEYARDTGERLWDVSSPIYVKGKHWGGFRVAVSMERIVERQRMLIMALVAIFLVFTAVVLGAVFILMQRAIEPVAKIVGDFAVATAGSPPSPPPR